MIDSAFNFVTTNSVPGLVVPGLKTMNFTAEPWKYIMTPQNF